MWPPTAIVSTSSILPTISRCMDSLLSVNVKSAQRQGLFLDNPASAISEQQE